MSGIRPDVGRSTEICTAILTLLVKLLDGNSDPCCNQWLHRTQPTLRKHRGTVNVQITSCEFETLYFPIVESINVVQIANNERSDCHFDHGETPYRD